MSLSADRIALADRAILRTFAQSSIAWQAIPHWDTGDRGQNRVRDDKQGDLVPHGSDPDPAPPFSSGSVEIEKADVPFRVTLGQALAETPDALLAAVIARTTALAEKVDKAVFDKLVEHQSDPVQATVGTPDTILRALLKGRQRLEDAGFHAPSCLIAGQEVFLALNLIENGLFILDDLLNAATIGSLYRSSKVGEGSLLLLGRRQDIGHRCAAEASAGEEPVDLAVSVPPSLEVVGDYTAAPAEIELGVRIRYATRVKDERGVVPVKLTFS